MENQWHSLKERLIQNNMDSSEFFAFGVDLMKEHAK